MKIISWLGKNRFFFVFILISAAALWGRTWLYEARDDIVTGGLESSLTAADDKTIILHFHDRPPFYYSIFGEVRGLCADPAARAFTGAGMPFLWRLTPARRQMEIIKADKGRECAVGWFKTPDREKFAKFTDSIYQERPLGAVGRSDNPWLGNGRPVEELLVNPHLTLLRKDVYSYGTELDALIAKLKPRQVHTTSESLNMLQMIHAGRADYFFISPEEADPLVSASGLPAADFRIIDFSNITEGNRRYIICTPTVEDETIEKLNLKIREEADKNRTRG
ncbi:MAG: transporter substrate-binding domain-containing protein [Pseudomonadota bacterium]